MAERVISPLGIDEDANGDRDEVRELLELQRMNDLVEFTFEVPVKRRVLPPTKDE